MKRYSSVLFLVLFLIGCKQNKSINENLEKAKDEELNVIYLRTRTDTVRYTQDIKIGNISHELELKLYSLNDSLIVIDNGNFKSVCHNFASEIVLTKRNDTILYKKLKKNIFKDSIDNADYKELVLGEIGYKSIRSNRLYFTIGFENADLPINSFYKSCKVAIFYRTEKKGQISFYNFKDGRD